jgi:hypothetical protein
LIAREVQQKGTFRLTGPRRQKLVKSFESPREALIRSSVWIVRI